MVDELLRPVDKGFRPKTGGRLVVHGVDICHDNIHMSPVACEVDCDFIIHTLQHTMTNSWYVRKLSSTDWVGIQEVKGAAGELYLL